MPDRNPSSSGSATPQVDSSEPTISDAQPYRTPEIVDSSPTSAGPMKSRLLWLVLLASGAAAAFGSYILMTPVQDFNATRRPVDPLPQHIEDFGFQRMPVEEFQPVEDLSTIPESFDPTAPVVP